MVAASVDFTISFDSPDEDGWIVARVLEVPGAMSQGRTREEARENALDALRTVLTPDEELAGETADADREHLRFTAAASSAATSNAISEPRAVERWPARSTPSGEVQMPKYRRFPATARSGRDSSVRYVVGVAPPANPR